MPIMIAIPDVGKPLAEAIDRLVACTIPAPGAVACPSGAAPPKPRVRACLIGA
jgi:hypothetical protein